MKKVKKKELEQLQQIVNAINEGQKTIGGLEMQKEALITETKAFAAALTTVQKELEKTYGNVTVNLSTGEITDADNKED